MVSSAALAGFALVALGMVCTPGPNMIYLLTRSIMQGRMAGFISLLGVTALLMAVPFAYGALQWAGGLYLLWLAWNAVKPGARSVLEPRRDLMVDGPRKLFLMGFVTNLLNPKIAVLYLSLLPQFIDPAQGHVLGQGIELGLLQISVSFSVNIVIVFTAGSLARIFATRPSWLKMQRWLMAGVLTGLAVRLVMDRRPA